MISLKQEKLIIKLANQSENQSDLADFNALMGAVNKIDMILSSLQCVRKSTKWYKKYFFHLLDLAIYNGYILYKSTNNKTGTFVNFHSLFIKHILQKYPPRRVEAKGDPTTFHFS